MYSRQGTTDAKLLIYYPLSQTFTENRMFSIDSPEVNNYRTKKGKQNENLKEIVQSDKMTIYAARI